jgi:hypothetical protein
MTRSAGEEGATGRRPSEPSKPEVLPAAAQAVNTREGRQAAHQFKTVADVLRACLARIEARQNG